MFVSHFIAAAKQLRKNMSTNEAPLDLPDALVEIGAAQGYLTHAEMAGCLPSVEFSSEVLEGVVLSLEAQSVAVFEAMLPFATIGLPTLVGQNCRSALAAENVDRFGASLGPDRMPALTDWLN